MVNPGDIEKDLSVSSETEGSHSHVDAHYASEVVVHRNGEEVVSSSPNRRPILYAVAALATAAVVVALPLVLVDRDTSKSSHNSVSNLALDLDDEPPQTMTATTAQQYDFDTFEYTAQDNEQCPGHLEGDYWEVSRVWAFEMAMGERGSAADRTFAVEPSHTVQESAVLFNVETVPEALPQDLAKPIWTASELEKRVKEEASKFYQPPTNATHPYPIFPDVTLEVLSKEDDRTPFVYAGSQGFLAACMMSFAQHLPLALTPDHLWTVVAQGFARHVHQNAEALREHFVAHEGKKEIRFRENRMKRGESPPEMWEELIFPRFSEAIGEQMSNQEAYETLSQKVFSTTDATAQAASEVVLMSAMKEFFEFTMVTSCGIPQIRLEGTREDWVALRERTAKLAQWMVPNSTHGELWITDIVLPILDQFLQAYDGHVNYCFWQTMVKFRNTGGGSGSYDFLSGWLPTLFPYLSMDEGETRPNPFLRSWQESASAMHEGPKPTEIPTQVSSVPVKWEYFGTDFPLHFHAGFRGITQEADGTLAPVLGWYVTNDPKQ